MSVPIPQLSPEPEGISRLEVNASNMSTPAMCFFGKKKNKGFIVLSQQNSIHVDNGFSIEENFDRQKASFVISAPGVRERKPLFVGFAESRGERGTHVTGWNELNGFLMALEIPGIYLQTDGELFYVFDHVQAKVIGRTKKIVTIEVYNPTDYDASVSILAESVEKSHKPLGYTSFLNWPEISVKSGETIQFSVNSHGKIGH